jgi:hypothetical protein
VFSAAPKQVQRQDELGSRPGSQLTCRKTSGVVHAVEAPQRWPGGTRARAWSVAWQGAASNSSASYGKAAVRSTDDDRERAARAGRVELRTARPPNLAGPARRNALATG